MKHEDINVGDNVVYIPRHLLSGPKENMFKNENIGVVTSKNDKYIFVRYRDKSGSEATSANDLFTLRNRPDLI